MRIELEGKILMKHTGLLHITRTLSLGAQKLYNILVYLAQPHLSEDKLFYQVSINDLRKTMSDTNQNNDYIVKLLHELKDTSVNYNIFGKVKGSTNAMGWMPLIADLGFIKDSDIVIYNFSNFMLEFLQKPNLYARINLSDQLKFSSKFTLSLWELCLEDLCTNKVNKSVLKVQYEKLRVFLGIKKVSGSFPLVNYSILKPAIKEINDKTDLNVSLEYIREGAKVTHIVFIIKDNNPSIRASLKLETCKKNRTIEDYEKAKKEEKAPILPFYGEFTPECKKILLNEIHDIQDSHPMKYKFANNIIELFNNKGFCPALIQNYLTSNKFKKLSDDGLFIYNIYDIVESTFPFEFRKLCEYIIDEIKFEEAA